MPNRIASSPCVRSEALANEQNPSWYLLAVLALPIALPIHAAGVNQTLPARVEQALKANKINNDALSVVMLRLPATRHRQSSMQTYRSIPPRP